MFDFLRPKVDLDEYFYTVTQSVWPGFESSIGEADRTGLLSVTERTYLEGQFRYLRLLTTMVYAAVRIENDGLQLGRVSKSLTDKRIPSVLVFYRTNRGATLPRVMSDPGAENYWFAQEMDIYQALVDLGIPEDVANNEANGYSVFRHFFMDLFTDHDEQIPGRELAFLVAMRFGRFALPDSSANGYDAKMRAVDALAVSWAKLSRRLLHEEFGGCKFVLGS